MRIVDKMYHLIFSYLTIMNAFVRFTMISYTGTIRLRGAICNNFGMNSYQQ
jgi:hypothetical protein